jgi:hypothetical protein
MLMLMLMLIMRLILTGGRVDIYIPKTPSKEGFINHCKSY